uniref:Twist-related protein 1-like n=1 Tax=Castor canadensis TaxID=51338 RepID=A0A8B7UGW0_CASCN|nr:twist-related protein 1-like [Castor canadensis]
MAVGRTEVEPLWGGGRSQGDPSGRGRAEGRRPLEGLQTPAPASAAAGLAVPCGSGGDGGLGGGGGGCCCGGDGGAALRRELGQTQPDSGIRVLQNTRHIALRWNGDVCMREPPLTRPVMYILLFLTGPFI